MPKNSVALKDIMGNVQESSGQMLAAPAPGLSLADGQPIWGQGCQHRPDIPRGVAVPASSPARESENAVLRKREQKE